MGRPPFSLRLPLRLNRDLAGPADIAIYDRPDGGSVRLIDMLHDVALHSVAE